MCKKYCHVFAYPLNDISLSSMSDSESESRLFNAVSTKVLKYFVVSLTDFRVKVSERRITCIHSFIQKEHTRNFSMLIPALQCANKYWADIFFWIWQFQINLVKSTKYTCSVFQLITISLFIVILLFYFSEVK